MILATWWGSACARGQVLPPALKDVGIDQRLGNVLPMDVTVRDEAGRAERFGDYFGHGRPVLVTFVYYKCPMLCTVTLNQLTRSLNALPESAGENFDVITLSFNPRETAELAREKKANYLRAYRRPTAEAGWHFLTAPAESIKELTDAAGFRYRWDEANQVYAHVSGVMVVSPAGKISRYFLGVDYPAEELRAAMNAARSEAVGPEAERVFLYCFHYDPATGKYGIIVSRALKVGGVLIMMGVFGMIGFFVMRERRSGGGGRPSPLPSPGVPGEGGEDGGVMAEGRSSS